LNIKHLEMKNFLSTYFLCMYYGGPVVSHVKVVLVFGGTGVTDPFPMPGTDVFYPNAWATIDGYEIGGVVFNSLSTANGTFVVQGQFDNAANACTTKSWISP
jgi:hypothetical protein